MLNDFSENLDISHYLDLNFLEDGSQKKKKLSFVKLHVCQLMVGTAGTGS